MKQTKIVAVLLLLFILLGGIAEQIYIKKTFDSLIYQNKQIKSKIENFEFEETNTELCKLETWWNKHVSILESLSNNRDLRNISTEISRLNSYIKSKNINDATASIEAIEDSAKFVKNLLSFKFAHII